MRGEVMTEEIEYRPVSVKDLLTEMIDVSGLAADLAFSALIYEDEDIAEEVLRLEERMEDLLYQVKIAAMLGSRRVEEAEMMSGVLHTASAAQKIADASGDVAKIVLKRIGAPPELRTVMQLAQETATRVIVKEGSPMDGAVIGALELETETGLVPIALRRDLKWTFDPPEDTVLKQGDVLFAKGHDDGIPLLCELATGHKCKVARPKSTDNRHLDRAMKTLVEMKNYTDLAVGLAYTAVLYANENVAHEVELLESKLDDMKYELEHHVLKAASTYKNVDRLRGLLHLGIALEIISDAAEQVVDIVLRDMDTHPLYRISLDESEEELTWATVQPKAPISGRTLKQMKLPTETGSFIMAVRKGGRWVFNPSGSTKINDGDVIISRGTRASEEELLRLCGIEAEQD